MMVVIFLVVHEFCSVDTVGSIVKMAFDRGLKKGDGGVQHVSQVVELMRDNIQSTTKSFENFLIEEFLPIRRPTKKILLARAIPLEGISRMHSIFFTSNDIITGSVLTCIQCTIKDRCTTCNVAKEKSKRTRKNKNV